MPTRWRWASSLTVRNVCQPNDHQSNLSAPGARRCSSRRRSQTTASATSSDSHLQSALNLPSRAHSARITTNIIVIVVANATIIIATATTEPLVQSVQIFLDLESSLGPRVELTNNRSFHPRGATRCCCCCGHQSCLQSRTKPSVVEILVRKLTR